MPEYVLEKFACANPKTPVVVIPAFIAFASAVTADYLTGYGLSLGPLYALVIIAVSWYCGVWWGSLFAFMSVFAQIEIGLLLGHNFPEPAYFYVSNGNKLFTYLVISFLISTVRTLYERANSTARVDYLTGLTNLMGFHERLSIELARHRREGGMFAVAYIDCDHFKVINDGLGYREGDRVLQTVGRVLKSSVREMNSRWSTRKRANSKCCSRSGNCGRSWTRP